MKTFTPEPVDRLEHISRYATLLAFAIGIVVFLFSPVWALSWRNKPFPGFLSETTMVVNNRSGAGWPGYESGLRPPYAILRFGGFPIADHHDYHRALASHSTGETVSIFTKLMDGSIRIFPRVGLIDFPQKDFNRLFWLPYFIGLAYFAIAVWIFWLRGSERSGRALAFFSANVAIVAGLLFDVITSHNSAPVWVISLSLLGGALISLALRFPVEWTPVHKRPWLLALPYLVSLGLAAWALFYLWNTQDPWKYLTARSMIYRYVALSALFFFAVMFYRASKTSQRLVQRQARLVLFGSLLAFLPIVAWFLTSSFGLQLPFNSELMLPWLLLFPLSVAVAIQRYLLKEIDSIVNRTIVYALVTAILAGFFAAMIGLSQRAFVALTGEESDSAIVITTLIVASAIAPIKDKVQCWVDRRWRELPTGPLKSFGDEVAFYVQMNDAQTIAQRFLVKSVESLRAESGAIIIYPQEGREEAQLTLGHWRGTALISVPLTCQGERYGHVMIGPRKGGGTYRRFEVDSLQYVAGQVARAIRIAEGLQSITGIPSRGLQ